MSDSRWQEAQSKTRPQQGNGDHRKDPEARGGSSRGDVRGEQAHEDTQHTSRVWQTKWNGTQTTRVREDIVKKMQHDTTQS